MKDLAQGHGSGYTARSEGQRPAALLSVPLPQPGYAWRTHGVRGLPSHLLMETLALNTFLPLEGSSQCCLGERAVQVKKVFWPSLASPTG